jgi:hypothetical protein
VFFWTDWSKCSRNKRIIDDKEWIDHPKWVDKATKYLDPFCYAIQSVLNFIHPRINYVKLDRWDTWSMDHTLAYIILPMLKQLKETKHGSPFTDMEDVPEHLRGTTTEDWEPQFTFDFYEEGKVKEGINDIHARWDWVMNEMIFAFERKANDTDWSATWEESERIQNGFRLFGKYYQGLWD